MAGSLLADVLGAAGRAGYTRAVRTSLEIRDASWTDPGAGHRHTGVVGDHKGFTVVLRGYDPGEVDALLDRVQRALASTDPALRASVRTELNHPGFPIRLRGYDRNEVDDYFRRAIDRLA